MNKLIITEKPSVSAAYAALLGAKKRMDGYWEGNHIRRSSGSSK